MTKLKEIIMKKDNLTSKEADDLIADAECTMNDYLINGDTEAAYEVCSEFFDLEPDHLMDLI